MKSKDLIAQQKKELSLKLTKAMQGGDENAAAEAFAEFSDGIQQAILDDAQAVLQSADTNALAARGARQLTSAEGKFYQKLIEAMRSNTPQQALSNLEIAMPETVLESVFEDIREGHPLLDKINFVHTAGKIKMIVNKTGVQLAVWGKLGAAITEELEGSIGEVDTGLLKLTAFMLVSNDMLDLGPAWIDRYVREILSEALAQTLENAIVNGDGKDAPIGMTRSVADDVTVTAGVYPQKTATSVTDLSPTTYGGLLAKIAKGPNDKTRAVTRVILVVNPVDYYTKIMPCTTIQGADGLYRADVLPFPTDVVQSAGMPQGKAVLGLAHRYFMAVGSDRNGSIEYDESYKFLEDQRTYKIKMYGNGLPLDDNAFQLLDISGLKPTVWKVEVANAEGNPVRTKEVATGN